VDREEGLTVPRLTMLLESGERRRAGERRVLATLINLGANDGKKLQEYLTAIEPKFGASVARQTGHDVDAVERPDYENEEWWAADG
jgi:hypothetical protein